MHCIQEVDIGLQHIQPAQPSQQQSSVVCPIKERASETLIGVAVRRDVVASRLDLVRYEMGWHIAAVDDDDNDVHNQYIVTVTATLIAVWQRLLQVMQ